MIGLWYQEFLNKYKSGMSHEFLFYFNVKDYIDNIRTIDRYLGDEFIKPRNFLITAFYDISTGLTFADEISRREFDKATQNIIADAYYGTPSRILPYLDKALKNTKMALFINHTDKIVPNGDVASLSYEERIALIWLCEWSVSEKVSCAGSTLFLIADNINDVNKELFKASYRVEPVMVELPAEEQRREYIEGLLKDKNVKTEIPADLFAKLSSGLSKKSIKDIKLKAEAEGIPISFDFIKEKKHDVLKKEYGDVLEFIYPEIGFEDIGGMEKAKNYLIKNVVEPIKRGDLRRVPMGILLCGPSGTGKTLLVNALAKTSGFNCVKIDMARILGQYVGESEKNFKKCLLGAKSQQPVIVFVDEIDTAFERGNAGDSGVSKNIFSEFLQFASDTTNRGRIIFIAATNRPDLLDPALKRAGRFDKKIPILLPEEKDRAGIFKMIFKKYNFETGIKTFDKYAKITDGYTGAEIETVVRKAYELANEGDSKGVINDKILSLAISKCRPNTGQVQLMTELAIKEIDDYDLLPEKYQNYLNQDKEA